MAVTVTEQWIRERVQLKHNHLEDVRSLALPGTYHEKIAVLGNGLRYFTRLKALDLSRNAIESLAGLENLHMLEKLNLYYNCVGSLEDLYRLRQLPNLQDLDLRLNPVARNEPDYRLFVIHMLPNLRRLDDRAVRDGERKAALMHFNTDQANQLTVHQPEPDREQAQPNPRVQHVQSLAKPKSVLDADDVSVLELMSGTPPGSLTGSTGTQPLITEYPPYGIMPPDQLGTHGNTQPSQSGGATYHNSHAHGIVSPAPTTPVTMVTTVGHTHNQTEPVHSQSAPTAMVDITAQHRPTKPAANSDPNLQFEDELSAYTSYKAKGYFTPHPVDHNVELQGPPGHPSTGQPPESDNPGPTAPAGWELHTPTEPTSNEPGPSSMPHLTVEGGQGRYAELEPPVAPLQQQHASMPAMPAMPTPEGTPMEPGVTQFMQQVSQLADKYWNGAQSLMKNERFKSRMLEMMNSWSASPVPYIPTPASSQPVGDIDPLEVQQLRHQVATLAGENTRLREQALTTPGLHDNTQDADGGKLKSSLIRAQRDVSIMRDRLQKSLDENKSLREQLSSRGVATTRETPGSVTGVPGGAHLGDLDDQNNQLKQEVSALHIRLRQSAHMQELAAMLQESHKSLVQTNEHLLKELEELRQRYHQEVRTLRWSYDQLKKTAGMSVPPGGMVTHQVGVMPTEYIPHSTSAI